MYELKLSNLAVSRPIAASMLLIFLMLLGGIGISRMSIDLFPNLEHPYLVVSTQVENLNPDEVEARVTIPLEKLLATLPNLSSIHAQSSLGQSTISLKFQWGSSMDKNKEKVKEKLEILKNILPKDTPEPVILPFDPSTMPIMQWVISQNQGEDATARKIAEQKIIPNLQNLDGVAALTLEGVQERQYQIHLHPEQLQVHQLTFEQVQSSLITQNLNLAGGSITQDNQIRSIQITGNYSSLYDLSQIKIPTKNGMIPLSALAVLKEITTPKGHISYINGKPCIGLSIFKEDGKNTVQLAKQIQKEMQRIEKELASEIKLQVVFNQSEFINQAISAIYTAICLGGLSAAGVLYVFLRNIRSTLTIFFTIPITVLICFFFMYLLGQNLNLLTLGALSLGIGMMIDNAIVIVENIEQQSTSTSNHKNAALLGANQMFLPMLASTLTSIIVFVPFLFIHGLISQIFFPLAIVVILSQLTSLIASFLFIPLVAAHTKQKSEPISSNRKNRLATKYHRILSFLIERPKTIVLSCFFLLGLSVFFMQFVEVEFMPHQDQSFIIIHTKSPAGTTLKATEENTLELLESLKSIPEIREVYSTVGGTPSASVLKHMNSNEANFYCLLHKKKARKTNDLQVAQAIEKQLQQQANIRYSLSASDPGFFDNQMKIRILSPNRMQAIEAAEQFTQQLADLTGIHRIQTQGLEEIPTISIHVEEGKAALLGIDRTSIAQQLYAITTGQEIFKLMNQKEDIPIRLFLYNQNRLTQAQTMEQITIYSPTQGKIPLKGLATIQKENQVNQQYRYNQQAQVMVSFEVKSRQRKENLKLVEHAITDLKSENPSIHVIQDGQATQIKESFGQMKFVCAFALLFIYMILAAQFESLLIPFVLIFSIPVIIIGIVFSLLLFHEPISASSFIGILLLIGVVINNAILLLDSIMQQMKKNLSLKQAILIGAPSRIRPIFMTATTTILGILPLLFGSGEGIEFQRPMSLVIVFGLLSSTFITLILIPSILALLEKQVKLSWESK